MNKKQEEDIDINKKRTVDVFYMLNGLFETELTILEREFVDNNNI